MFTTQTDPTKLCFAEVLEVMSASGFVIEGAIATKFRRVNIHDQAVYGICFFNDDDERGTGFDTGFVYIFRNAQGELEGTF